MRKADRVRSIELMMQAGEWHYLTSPTELSPDWGVAPATIQHDALEAGRNLRRAMTDDELRDEVIGHLVEIAQLAKDDGQFAPAIAALKCQLEARGLLSRRIEVTLHQVEQMTPEAKARAVLADSTLGPIIRRLVAEDAPPMLGVGE